jgi:glutathione S-transferase
MIGEALGINELWLFVLSGLLLAMNPHGRIPVIRDGEATVWESHAILRYLAARHGAARFWSDDPVVRAGVDGWMDWSHTALQPDFLNGGVLGILPDAGRQAKLARNQRGAGALCKGFRQA